MKLILTYLVVFALSIGCISPTDQSKDAQDYDLSKVPYKLYAPTETIKLHYDLQEISGLTYLSTNKLGAVEDETGKFYILDANTGDVLNKIKFGKSGDYEGVEYDDGTVWVMKSSGDFISFQFEGDNAINIEEYKSEFTSRNNLEGLGYLNGTLLIAAKGDGQIDGIEKKGKGIYKLEEAKARSLLFIEKRDLEKFIEKRDHFNSMRDFDPSAIAVHPLTSDIYILSADHVLVVYDGELKLKEVVKLDKKIFYQPEGICFSPQGQLFISSEGGQNRGRLFSFNKLTK
ncbi:SdiA-regulated domain-containing protein [Fulvivirga sp.]|uniref:SdiA-regulated domain-containing protein n=1 Tax=Fulvivirga sp. TaxID=1931237 RepID=UPI0032EBE25E